MDLILDIVTVVALLANLFRILTTAVFSYTTGRAATTLTAVLLLSACGSLPAVKLMAETRTLPVDINTPLAKIVAASTPQGEHSGFRLMPLGVYSLDARLELAKRATRSLDLQYYVIENDGAGRLLLRALKQAAQRGVRVRLLIDDLYTARTEQLLLALGATPNIEIRLFNPFCCARNSLAARFIASALDLGRLNHRMHNKLFVADGVMAVVGGRNIADEYFTLGTSQNFIDMDTLVAGQVVADLNGMFDRYWNSREVYPLAAIATPQADTASMTADFDAQVDMAGDGPTVTLPPTDVLGYGPIGEEMDAGIIGFLWGKAEAVADPPEKLRSTSNVEAYETSVTKRFLAEVDAAQRDVFITSPYLVPGEPGLEHLKVLHSYGVAVTLLTNSLAANDAAIVHSGYARYRKRLLKAGADLYELSPARTRRGLREGAFGSSLGRLHSKTAVIDRRRLFIGSANLDPRSATQNTEMGLFIESPQLAREMLRIINISRLENAYRVRLDKDGQLEWLAIEGNEEVVLHSEPEASALTRLKVFLLGPLIPESLL
jgi:putative cardiolipin synthase